MLSYYSLNCRKNTESKYQKSCKDKKRKNKTAYYVKIKNQNLLNSKKLVDY